MNPKRIVHVVLAVALLTVAIPAMARPNPCSVVCTCASECDVVCSVGSIIRTCRVAGLCDEKCFAAAAPRSSASLLAEIYSEPIAQSPSATSAEPQISVAPLAQP